MASMEGVAEWRMESDRVAAGAAVVIFVLLSVVIGNVAEVRRLLDPSQRRAVDGRRGVLRSIRSVPPPRHRPSRRRPLSCLRRVDGAAWIMDAAALAVVCMAVQAVTKQPLSATSQPGTIAKVKSRQ